MTRWPAAALVGILTAAAAGGVLWAMLDDPGGKRDPKRLDIQTQTHEQRPIVHGDNRSTDATLSVRLLKVGAPGAEPTIGVAANGTLFVTGLTGTPGQVWRSFDRGATWRDAGDPVRPTRDVDPYLFLDPWTDRLYSGNLQVACSNLHWTDDQGSRWNQTHTGGCGVAGHDHASLAAGPPPEGFATQGYANVLYYTFQALVPAGGAWVTTSLDGGLTWSKTGAKVFDSDCQGGLTGAPAVAPDGTVYVPKPGCDGLRVAVSRDVGASWAVADLKDVGMSGGRPPLVPGLPLGLGVDSPLTGTFSSNPAVAVDEAGTVYALWAGRDGLLYLAHSSDQGITWSKPTRATPPGVTVTAFGAMAAGAAGQLGIAYLATTDDPAGWRGREAHYAPDKTAWHLYVTLSTDAAQPSPSFVTVRATPDEDPVQLGCIWQSGGDHACRNLRDFIGATHRDGRFYAAFADGCDRCTKAADSRRADMVVAVVDEGPSLLGGRLAPYR